jgi:proton-dependent oligopeptide transporter, POT family
MNIVVLVGLLITLLTIFPVLAQLRGHPRGLFVLFFAEMWERFSYYGMRGLLIFYLTQHFLFDDRFAQGQYGAYTSLVYLLPLIGGFLADRYLGTRKAIAAGALFLVVGHLLMAVEQPPAQQVLTYQGQHYRFDVQGRMEAREAKLAVGQGLYDFGATPEGGLAIHGLPEGAPLPAVLPQGSYALGVAGRQPFFMGVMYLALSLIIVGVGFLKANISSIVGQLYDGPEDPRRDPGFTLYYYGINLGAFWAAILCGLLGQTVGWWAGFGLAGIGMAAGWIVFVLGKPLLEGKAEPPDPVRLAAPVLGPLSREWIIYLGGIVATAVVWVLVQRHEAVGMILTVGSVLVIRYFFTAMAEEMNAAERGRMWLALILIAGSVIFWTLFEQAGSSLNQFAERNTQLPNAGFFSMTAAQTQSFNSGFILLLAPAFSLLSAMLDRRRLDPTAPNKFALALMQVGAGFLVLVWGAHFADAQARVPLIFLAVAYLLHTTGELCLSPVGLSQMTKLSTPTIISTLMATWFLASSWAQWLGGLVAQLTATETVAGEVLDPHKALATYVGVFQQIGLWAIALGLGLWLLEPFVKKLAHGAK